MSIQRKASVMPLHRSREVQFKNGEVTLSGTLTIPFRKRSSGNGPKPPVVILVHGSGPHLRDQIIGKHEVFLVLATYLTRRGIAVLRYDKRGVGKSTGDFSKANVFDFASDAGAAAAFLQTVNEVDGNRIGMIGHSEGAVATPICINSISGINVAVLLGAPCLPGATFMHSMVAHVGHRYGVSDDRIEIQMARVAKVFKLLAINGSDRDATDAINNYRASWNAEDKNVQMKNPSEDFVWGITDPAGLISKWQRTRMSYDPGVALARLKVPVLSVLGAKDTQIVADEHMPAFAQAISRSGNADVTIVKIPNTNHLFQTCSTGYADEWDQIEETLSPIVLKVIVDWLKTKFVAPG
jgi:pimeloyl-ACP methyl ester carboxylesterase